MEVEEKYGFELMPGDLSDPWAVAPIKPESWKAEVRRVLRKMEGTKVGPMLLSAIHRYQRWVRIRPYWWSTTDTAEGPFYKRNPCNAQSLPQRYVVDGRWIYSVVLISPERYGQCSPCAGGAVHDDHEILFHELVHSLRHVSEKWSGFEPLGGGLKNYTNLEEFIAVVLTNIYASANGKKTLRAGHLGHGVLPSALADSFGFYASSNQVYPLIKQFYADHKELGALLTTVEVPFNPIWAYWKDADKARRLSESAKH